jgi:hypothetical protein
MASDRGWTDRRMDVVIGSLLRSGVVLSALIVLFGGEEVTFCRCGPSSRTLPEPLVSGYDFIEAVRGFDSAAPLRTLTGRNNAR